MKKQKERNIRGQAVGGGQNGSLALALAFG